MPESPGDLDVVNVRGAVPGLPTLVIGRKLFETESDVELAFIVGRTLAADPPRPPAALAGLRARRWPSWRSRCARRSGWSTPSGRSRPEVTGGVEQYAGFLTRTLPPQVLEQVSVLVKRFGAAHGGDPGAVGTVLPRWARAACLTTIRAGLLLAGDLEVAVRLGEALAAPVGIDPERRGPRPLRLEHVGELLRAAHRARPTHDHAVAALREACSVRRAKGGFASP